MIEIYHNISPLWAYNTADMRDGGRLAVGNVGDIPQPVGKLRSTLHAHRRLPYEQKRTPLRLRAREGAVRDFSPKPAAGLVWMRVAAVGGGVLIEGFCGGKGEFYIV